MFAISLMLAAAFATNQVSANTNTSRADLHGSITVRITGCNIDRGGRTVALVNHDQLTAIRFDSPVVKLTAPEGYDSFAVNVGNCQTEFDALVLGGSIRDVFAFAHRGAIAVPYCAKQDCFEYKLDGGHLMGKLPAVAGLSVELIDDIGNRIAGIIQRDVYYFDLLAVGHYRLRVSGVNWHKDLRDINVRDTNSYTRSSLISNISIGDLSGANRFRPKTSSGGLHTLLHTLGWSRVDDGAHAWKSPNL